MLDESGEFKSPVRTIIFSPTARTKPIMKIVAGRERASYVSLEQRRLLVVVISDATGTPNVVTLSVTGTPLKGSLAYSPLTCFGNGPHVKRLENSESIPLQDRTTLARFVDTVILSTKKGGEA